MRGLLRHGGLWKFTVFCMVTACSWEPSSGTGERSAAEEEQGEQRCPVSPCSSGVATIVHPPSGHVVVVEGGVRTGAILVEVRVSSRGPEGPSTSLPSPSSRLLLSPRRRSPCLGHVLILANDTEVGEICVEGQEQGQGSEDREALEGEKRRALEASRSVRRWRIMLGVGLMGHGRKLNFLSEEGRQVFQTWCVFRQEEARADTSRLQELPSRQALRHGAGRGERRSERQEQRCRRQIWLFARRPVHE
eukprot:764862-Hanusia_phi.AAC.1